MKDSFGGRADLSLPFAGKAPIGFIPDGQGIVDQTGQTFTFSGMFRLPFGLDKGGNRVKPRQYQHAFYLADDHQTTVAVESSERSLGWPTRSEEHTSELQSPCNLVCRLLLEKKKKTKEQNHYLFTSTDSR